MRSPLTNGSQRTRLLIEGSTPILREKDIMTPQQANTPARRIYLAVQLMYTARDSRLHHETYFILDARPGAGCAERLATHCGRQRSILPGEIYKALKSAKALIAYEKELIDHATRGTNLRRGRQTDRKSA